MTDKMKLKLQTLLLEWEPIWALYWSQNRFVYDKASTYPHMLFDGRAQK
jgi:hypothetical protein